ncbi:MAG: acetyl-coenzyme A synthetase N-terminal domain-containing protein, partial [Dehalococcoidia bacterium]
MTTTSQQIESILQESRVFPPSPEFSAGAHIRSMDEYRALAKEAEEDLEGFWAKRAEDLHWFKKWDRVLDWQPPFAKWFVGGTTNAAYNCLDRHLDGPRRNKAALIWEGEPGDERILTYQTLHREVCKFANVLKSLGVQKGDRVGVYMPLV